MRKLILLLSIFFLLIFTTIIKNSTKEIEKKIYNTEENLRVLKNKHEMVLMDFSYLTTPEKLMEYQSKYFENELDQVDIKKLKKITIKKNPPSRSAKLRYAVKEKDVVNFEKGILEKFNYLLEIENLSNKIWEN